MYVFLIKSGCVSNPALNLLNGLGEDTNLLADENLEKEKIEHWCVLQVCVDSESELTNQNVPFLN